MAPKEQVDIIRGAWLHVFATHATVQQDPTHVLCYWALKMRNHGFQLGVTMGIGTGPAWEQPRVTAGLKHLFLFQVLQTVVDEVLHCLEHAPILELSLGNFVTRIQKPSEA